MPAAEKSPAPTPGEAALAEATAAVVAARDTLTAAEQRAERLRSIIAEEAPARDALRESIAEDGAKALARLARGEEAPETLAHMTRAETAGRAAAAARMALPDAEAAVERARVELDRLRRERMDRVKALLLERANVVGKLYHEAVKTAGARLRDLAGVSAALTSVGGIDIAMSGGEDALSTPRFELPCLRDNAVHYSPTIHIRSLPEYRVEQEWRAMIAQLLAEP